MSGIHFSSFVDRVETVAQNAIRSCYPRAWDENHITYTLLHELVSKFQRTDVYGLDRPFSTRWDAFKLSGTSEHRHGDIAVIVRHKSWDGTTLNGIGFFEAKRRTPLRAEFDSYKQSQIKRLLKLTPHLNLLLYDYAPISGYQDNLKSQVNLADPNFWHSRYDLRENAVVAQHTHAASVQATISAQIGTANLELYKFAVPFSVQLVTRYLRGFDLEFGQKVEDTVKSFADKKGSPSFLLVLGVNSDGSEPTLPDNFVNPDKYSVISGGKDSA